MRGPMQAGLSMPELRVHLHSSLQEKIDDSDPAKLTGPGESVPHLSFGRRGLQPAIFTKEACDNVEPPASGCSFQVQTRAATRKELGRLPAPVLQAAVDPAISI